MTTIYLNRDDAEQVRAVPLWWQEQGLQHTATGYGSKIPTRYKALCMGNFAGCTAASSPTRVHVTSCLEKKSKLWIFN